MTPRSLIKVSDERTASIFRAEEQYEQQNEQAASGGSYWLTP
jgi:hypothetical protein